MGVGPQCTCGLGLMSAREEKIAHSQNQPRKPQTCPESPGHRSRMPLGLPFRLSPSCNCSLWGFPAEYQTEPLASFVGTVLWAYV